MPRPQCISRALPLLFLLSPLGACGGGDAPGADLPAAAIQAWQGSVATSEGAQNVRNPDRPLLPDGSVRVDTAWRVSQAGAWQRPTALALGGENVFLLDPPAGLVHVVTQQGEEQDDIGDAAGFSEPVSIAWSDGTIAVGDQGRLGILMMRDDGLTREPVRGLDRPAVHGLASGGFFANPYAGLTHQWRAWGPRRDTTMLELPRWGESAYCASVSGGRWILQADCASPSFRVFDEAGKLVRQVGVDRPAAAAPAAPALSDSALGELQQQLMAGEPDDSVLARLLAAGGPARVTRGARHDPASKLFALWGQLPAGGAWVDLFSEEGVYLATVRFGRPWADVGFARSTLFALEEGENGAVTLVAYRLHLPSNALSAARDAARARGAGSSGG
ncbi:MAG TPA: hypothetical protein VF746_02955 [Longimicrobium sp.]